MLGQSGGGDLLERLFTEVLREFHLSKKSKSKMFKELLIKLATLALFTSSVESPQDFAVCKKLSVVLSAAFQDPEAYLCDSCFINSGELIRRLSATAGEHIVLADIKIAVLKNKNQKINDLNHRDIGKRVLGVQTIHGGMTLWSYHAFIYYQGLIIDLSYKNTVEHFSSYYTAMFRRMNVRVTKKDEPEKYLVFNNQSDLEIGLLPGLEYLKKFRNKRANYTHAEEEDDLKSLLASTTFVGITKFLEEKTNR